MPSDGIFFILNWMIAVLLFVHWIHEQAGMVWIWSNTVSIMPDIHHRRIIIVGTWLYFFFNIIFCSTKITWKVSMNHVIIISMGFFLTLGSFYYTKLFNFLLSRCIGDASSSRELLHKYVKAKFPRWKWSVDGPCREGEFSAMKMKSWWTLPWLKTQRL
jgi:hypothetical protein